MAVDYTKAAVSKGEIYRKWGEIKEVTKGKGAKADNVMINTSPDFAVLGNTIHPEAGVPFKILGKRLLQKFKNPFYQDGDELSESSKALNYKASNEAFEQLLQEQEQVNKMIGNDKQFADVGSTQYQQQAYGGEVPRYASGGKSYYEGGRVSEDDGLPLGKIGGGVGGGIGALIAGAMGKHYWDKYNVGDRIRNRWHNGSWDDPNNPSGMAAKEAEKEIEIRKAILGGGGEHVRKYPYFATQGIDVARKWYPNADIESEFNALYPEYDWGEEPNPFAQVAAQAPANVYGGYVPRYAQGGKKEEEERGNPMLPMLGLGAGSGFAVSRLYDYINSPAEPKKPKKTTAKPEDKSHAKGRDLEPQRPGSEAVNVKTNYRRMPDGTISEVPPPSDTDSYNPIYDPVGKPWDVDEEEYEDLRKPPIPNQAPIIKVTDSRLKDFPKKTYGTGPSPIVQSPFVRRVTLDDIPEKTWELNGEHDHMKPGIGAEFIGQDPYEGLDDIPEFAKPKPTLPLVGMTPKNAQGGQVPRYAQGGDIGDSDQLSPEEYAMLTAPTMETGDEASYPQTAEVSVGGSIPRYQPAMAQAYMPAQQVPQPEMESYQEATPEDYANISGMQAIQAANGAMIPRYSAGGSPADRIRMENEMAKQRLNQQQPKQSLDWSPVAEGLGNLNTGGYGLIDLLFRNKNNQVDLNDRYYSTLINALQQQAASAGDAGSVPMIPSMAPPKEPPMPEKESDIDPMFITSFPNPMAGVVGKALLDKLKTTDNERADALERLASRRREAGKAGSSAERAAMILEARRQYSKDMEAAGRATSESNKETRAEYARTMAAIGESESSKAMEAAKHNVEEKTRVDDLNARRHAAYRQMVASRNYAYEQEKRAWENQERMNSYTNSMNAYNANQAANASRNQFLMQIAGLNAERDRAHMLHNYQLNTEHANRNKAWWKVLGSLGLGLGGAGLGAAIGGPAGAIGGFGAGMGLGRLLKHGGEVKRYNSGNGYRSRNADIEDMAREYQMEEYRRIRDHSRPLQYKNPFK